MTRFTFKNANLQEKTNLIKIERAFYDFRVDIINQNYELKWERR